MLSERLEQDVPLFRSIVDLFALLLACHLPIDLNSIVACLFSFLLLLILLALDSKMDLTCR